MPIRILVIEDEARIRENIAELLRLKEYEVKTASDGAEGVDLAQQWLPDLILCDIMMRTMDGYRVLETVRSSPVLTALPFIFLTAKGDMVDLRRGMSLGADDYLIKPFKAGDLLSAIESRLLRHRQQQPETPPSAAFRETVPGRSSRGSTLLKTEECFYFFTEKRGYYARHPQGTFQIDTTLEKLTADLDPRHFFRVNRKLILHRKVIQKYSYWDKGKYCLFLELGGESEEAILPKARYNPFKEWLASRIS